MSSAKNGAFETELTVKELQVLEQTWGNLSFLMNKAQQTPTNFKLSLLGKDAEVRAKGFLTSDEEPDISIDADLSKLNLSIVEPLTMGQLKDLKGALTGRLEVRGKTKDPDIAGQVNIRNTSFLSTFTNTFFAIDNDSHLY